MMNYFHLQLNKLPCYKGLLKKMVEINKEYELKKYMEKHKSVTLTLTKAYVLLKTYNHTNN